MKTNLISSRTSAFFTALFLLICVLMPLIATAQTHEPDLADWLTEHPLVSAAIRWEDASGIKAYPDWSAAQKADLLEMYHKVWNGKPLGLTNPPPNTFYPADDERTRTRLSKNHAWPLFVAQVAYSLAVETGEWVPWSLTEYSQEELVELFDGTRVFYLDTDSGGYFIRIRSIPAPPDFTFEFLNANRMIAQDRLHTIENLLDWCRFNMVHFSSGGVGSSMIAGTMEDHWQYRGAVPISRVILGTVRDSDKRFSHFTAGCWGTTDFLSAVLRVVNIPVKHAQVREQAPLYFAHAVPYFMSEGKYLSHGDDPYSGGMISTPLIPIEELLIDEATYDAWFGPSVPPEVSNVGRKPAELAIKYLPRILLRGRCYDLMNRNSSENSYVRKLFWYLDAFKLFWYIDFIYSLEELEAMNFWDRVDTQIDNLGGCPLSDTIVTFDANAVSNDLLVVEVSSGNGQPVEGELVVFHATSVQENGEMEFWKRKWTDAAGRVRMRFENNVDLEIWIGYRVTRVSLNGEGFNKNHKGHSDIFHGSELKRGENLLLVSLLDATNIATETPQLPEDVNQDSIVNIGDLTLVASNFGKRGENAADVNGDKIVNIVDLTLVAAAFGNTAAAPEVWSLHPDMMPTRTQVEAWLHEARLLNLADPTFQRGIQALEQLLATLTPKETQLLPNYPNPFNPETWIPYQLATATDVQITIYDATGKVVRRLDVGHQPAGYYTDRSRAAYWDGKNALGEPVASGVYFYTITTGELTATRKMLIQK